MRLARENKRFGTEGGMELDRTPSTTRAASPLRDASDSSLFDDNNRAASHAVSRKRRHPTGFRPPARLQTPVFRAKQGQNNFCQN